MYKVCIYNNGTETIIHYPSSDKEIPHLDKLPLKEGLSQVDSLSFNVYKNNPGYNNLFELTTKVKVFDVRDNTVRFTGRVLDVNEKMDSNGLFYKEVTCEGAMSFLNDSKQRVNSFLTSNPQDYLSQILAIHNGKVDVSKQIQVGNVNVTGSIAYSCNFETTLAAILAVKDSIGGDIRIRETNGTLYMDWLQSFDANVTDVKLGENMKDIVKSKDITSLGTRIIPLGANNLTISSVNGGLDYIEDATAKATYGVIEKTVEYKDITSATELKNTCIADLNKYTQPLYLLESSALDLSYLTGNKAEQFTLGTSLHIVNSVMAIDSTYKIVEIDIDLLQPYNPKLTIANFPLKLITTINDLRQSSIQNNGVYNGVQVGDSFGIRIVKSDGSVATTLNATDGISIENLLKNIKVFFVDTDGNLTLDGKLKVTGNGVNLLQAYLDAYGGKLKIYDNNGYLNAAIGVESGTSGNIGGTFVLYKDSPSDLSPDSDQYKRVELGISGGNNAGIANLRDDTGNTRALMYADSNVGPVIALLDSSGNIITRLTTSYGIVGGEVLATQEWVLSQGFAHS